MANQQQKLIRHWKNQGYFVINLIVCTPVGMPDIIALKPDKVVFIESKENTDRLSSLQKIWLNRLTNKGFECYVNDLIWKLPYTQH